MVFGFFFQAEDGIRDCIVTGVQTCALPIFFDGGEDGIDLGGHAPPLPDLRRNEFGGEQARRAGVRGVHDVVTEVLVPPPLQRGLVLLARRLLPVGLVGRLLRALGMRDFYNTKQRGIIFFFRRFGIK